MSDEKPQTEEQKSLKIELLEKISSLSTAGFGLVAALAWNEAIQGMFTQFFPKPGENLIALTGYALFITIIVVIITVQLSRMVNTAKKALEKTKK